MSESQEQSLSQKEPQNPPIIPVDPSLFEAYKDANIHYPQTAPNIAAILVGAQLFRGLVSGQMSLESYVYSEFTDEQLQFLQDRAEALHQAYQIDKIYGIATPSKLGVNVQWDKVKVILIKTENNFATWALGQEYDGAVVDPSQNSEVNSIKRLEKLFRSQSHAEKAQIFVGWLEEAAKTLVTPEARSLAKKYRNDFRLNPGHEEIKMQYVKELNNMIRSRVIAKANTDLEQKIIVPESVLKTFLKDISFGVARQKLRVRPIRP